jgi:ubiquinone/menaquinone biosynthesis C-methylase UbiE
MDRPAHPIQGSKKPPLPKPPTGGGTTDWAKVAQWYDALVGDEGSEYQREVVMPGALRLLDFEGRGLGGKSVLDVACGQGVFSRQLQGRGAVVTGIDAADELIAAAKERGSESAAHAGPEINYLLGDARELKGLDDAAFDLAVCLLAIQNIHPSGAVFKAVSRVLKPGGKFVVVMMHPAFRSPKSTHWGWIPDGEKGAAGGVQFRRVDKYLTPRKEPIVTHPGMKTGEYTWTFHQPIGEYINEARKAGMLIDAMEEWPSHKVSTSGPRAGAENTARKEIPMFMALRAVKM